MGGNIFNESNQWNKRKFEELFPPIYIVLGGTIFNEANQRNRYKFYELFPPNYIVLGGFILRYRQKTLKLKNQLHISAD